MASDQTHEVFVLVYADLVTSLQNGSPQTFGVYPPGTSWASTAVSTDQFFWSHFFTAKNHLNKVLPNQQTNKKQTLSIPPMGGGITQPHHPNGRGGSQVSGVNCSDNFLLASGISSSISVFDIEPGSPEKG